MNLFRLFHREKQLMKLTEEVRLLTEREQNKTNAFITELNRSINQVFSLLQHHLTGSIQQETVRQELRIAPQHTPNASRPSSVLRTSPTKFNLRDIQKDL